MIFDIFTKPIENALTVVDKILFEGEAPTKRELAKLINDGITIIAISQATGIAVDVIESIVESKDGD